MSQKPALQSRTFPSRIAELGFSVQLPEDWISHELPPDEADFNDPTKFVPLAIVTAPHSAIVFAFAARPAYSDGTLHDWALFLLNHNQLKPRAIGVHQVGALPAIVGEATQESELGPMVVRFAFCEDGQRLINITLSAPELLADSVRHFWFAALESFALSQPKGPTVRVQADPVTSQPAAPEPEPAPAAETDPASAGGAGAWAAHALADDAATLDPEHPINVNLRNKAAGLVPNLVSTDDAEKCAMVAAGAIMAKFGVPYGWHVIDDGKRTLVLEPTGGVQINLSLLPRENRGPDEILDAIEAAAREDYPKPEFMRLQEGRIHALAMRNIHDGDQPLEQMHLLVPWREEKYVLRARVTATPERSTAAANLGQLILESVTYVFQASRPAEEPTPPPPNDGQPAWWHGALALETAGRLEEAEETITKGANHLGGAASVAQMYANRMMRLQAAGDAAGALDAFRRADRWISFYASQATSGGEGAALSRERDQFRAQLVTAFGSDPGETSA